MQRKSKTYKCTFKKNALRSFQSGKITISKAAKLADMDIYDFISECKKNEIPIINITKEQLQKEVNDFNRR